MHQTNFVYVSKISFRIHNASTNGVGVLLLTLINLASEYNVSTCAKRSLVVFNSAVNRIDASLAL